MRSIKSLAIATLLASGCIAFGAFASAEDATAPVNPEAKTGDKALDDLMAKEKEARKACKIDICSVLRGKKAEGADIGCHVVQTWPKAALDELLGRAHVSWPWSNVHCQSDISIKRGTLVSAMTEAKYDASFDTHTVTCEIERGAGSENYTFKVTLTPKVTFEGGKATKAELHWGDIEAPVLAKGVIWPITAIDNKTGLLSGQFTSMVNAFVDKRCDEVKGELKLN